MNAQTKEGAKDVVLTQRQLCDLELLLNGGFAPLTGFLDEANYNSVCNDMRLVDGTVWPMPIVLDVSATLGISVGDTLTLKDEYGVPLASMEVTSVYTPNKQDEVIKVYGTNDPTHWGVNYVLNHTQDTYVGGPVTEITPIDHGDFLDLRHTPAQVKELLAKRGKKGTAGFQTRNPMHRAHAAIVEHIAKEHDIDVLVHPVVGQTKSGDIDYVPRVNAYRAAMDEGNMHDYTELSLLPLAMRMAGPREALWHALIRKNYGCTHFIIGRDHAGPGKDKDGNPFYDPYAAHDLVESLKDEIGITPLTVPEIVYSKAQDKYVFRDDVSDDEEIMALSGTEVRRRLQEDEDIPEWFSYPSVIEVLRRIEKRRGVCIFFTGLSGAGKSTLARRLVGRLREMTGRYITLLDGDVVRRHLSKGLGFSREDREANIERIGYVSSEIVRHGGLVVCSAIAPHEGPRLVNRSLISQDGAYVEVYVATPLEVCEERDVKGLYAKARSGEIKNFTGISDSYDIPENPEITIDTTKMSARESVDHIIEYISENDII